MLTGETIQDLTARIAGLPIAISISDPGRPDCPLVTVNPKFEELTGYAAAEVVGRNCRFMQADLDNTDARAAIREALRTGRGTEVVLRNRTRDGEEFDNLLIMSPVPLAASGDEILLGSQFRVTRSTSPESVRAQADRVRETLARLGEHRRELQNERYRSLAQTAVDLVRTWYAPGSGSAVRPTPG